MGTTVIKNGRIITAADDYFADILVEDDRIKLIGQNLQLKADRTIDAGGKYVIPGGIDCHTHMELPVGTVVSSDDFETGTVAAAHGGTTTIIDFATQARGGSMHAALDEWLAKAEGKAVVMSAPLTPDHLIRTRAWPLWLEKPALDCNRGGPTPFRRLPYRMDL